QGHDSHVQQQQKDALGAMKPPEGDTLECAPFHKVFREELKDVRERRKHLERAQARASNGTEASFTKLEQILESVRKHQAGLQSFRSMRRIEASRRNASALRLRFSQSFASLRQRLSQAKVRSTTQRRGSTMNPFVRSERLTISVSSCGKIFAKAF